MKFNLVSSEPDGVVRVASNGDLSVTDFRTDVNPLQQLLGEDWIRSNLLLDLRKTQYMDSSAVGWLIKSSKAIKAGGGKMVVHSVHPAVQQIFDLLRIGLFIPIVDSEAAARELATGAS